MKKKIALVTGGSRGLGKNTAIKLALKGLDVIITYHSKKEEASQVVEEINKAGGKAAALQLNIGDVRSFGFFFERVAQVLKAVFNTEGFDYLVNNAGIGMNVPFKDTTEEQFDQLMNVQFKGVYFFTQKALNYLKDGGGIINISRNVKAVTALGRIGEPDDIGGVVAFLCTEDARWITAQRIEVSGGMNL